MSMTCLITGASSGIGKATAIGLGRMGARVVIVCRDPARGKNALDEIRTQSGSQLVELMIADLSSIRNIRDLAGAFISRYPRLDVLINNAGVVMRRRQTTEDGLEMTFAVNHLAYFLLTNLLVPVLERSVSARIVERFVRCAFGGQN